MGRRVLLVLGAIGLVVGLAACGSNGNNGETTTTMTAQQYKAFLHRISHREDQAHQVLDQSLHAKSLTDIEHALTSFADDQGSVAGQLSQVTPPTNARAANAALIKGLNDTATGIRAVLPQVAAAGTPQAALKAMQAAKAPQQAGQEVDAALATLKKLGYISQIS
jgi:hypothetical protein